MIFINNRHWLVALRRKRKLTQKQVALRSFIDRSYYVQIEKGTKNPSLEVSINLAKVLKFHHSIFELEHNPFTVALKNSPMIIAHCDKELRYTWIFNPHPDFDPRAVIGQTDSELDENEGTLALMRLKAEVLEKQKPIRRNILFPLSNGKIGYDIFAHILLDQEGKVIGVATASTELNILSQSSNLAE